MPDPDTANTVAGVLQGGPQKASVITASVIGGIISLHFVDKMTPKQRVFSILSGTGMAYWLAPLISHFYMVEAYTGGIGFLIGLFGMSVCSTVFVKIKDGKLFGLLGNANQDAES